MEIEVWNQRLRHAEPEARRPRRERPLGKTADVEQGFQNGESELLVVGNRSQEEGRREHGWRSSRKGYGDAHLGR